MNSITIMIFPQFFALDRYLIDKSTTLEDLTPLISWSNNIKNKSGLYSLCYILGQITNMKLLKCASVNLAYYVQLENQVMFGRASEEKQGGSKSQHSIHRSRV